MPNEEYQQLRARLAEAEETLRAIREGEVDAVVVNGPRGLQVYTLKGADEPYRRLIERMREGAVTLTPDGIILYCNPEFSTLVGKAVSLLTGSPFQEFVVRTDRELFANMLRAAEQTSLRGEVRLHAQHGGAAPVLLSLSTVDSGDERSVCVVVTDLSEQKRGEEIVASEQLARLILEQAAQPIVVIDEQARIVRASGEAVELAGGTILQQFFEEALPLMVRRHEDRPAELEPLRQEELLQAGREGRVLRDWEACLPKQNATDRELLVSAAPLWGAKGVFHGCVVTLIDVTERRRAARAAQEAAEAQALTAGLMRGQEDERRRLARELHDGLNQKIAALTLRIRAMGERLHPTFQNEVRALERCAEDVCEETRRVSHELHPAALEHLGLVASLRELCQEFSEQSGVKTEFASDALPDSLPLEIGTCFYRVAQEALRNVAKHAQGGGAGVHLLIEGAELCLKISDRGRGFNVDEAWGLGGLGLTSMQERMRLLGGRLDIRSKPGAGAVVLARVPWRGESGHRASA